MVEPVANQNTTDPAAADKAAADKVVADRTAADKVVADKAAADKVVADKAAADKAAVVPETYVDFKMPEGVTVDKAALDEFAPVAKALKLTQEQAQQLVDLYSKKAVASANSQVDEFNKTTGKWLDTAKADPEIGGAQYDETLGFANKAIDKFGTPALREALTVTGAGNHPELMRFCRRVGVAMSDDTLHFGNAPNTGNKTAAEILYPDHPSKA